MTEKVKKEKSVVVQKMSEVDTFITQAIGNSLPVETMERLFALKKEIKAEQAREAYVSAMARFQSQCPVIEKKKAVKNKDGATVRYKYAPLDQIVEQVKKPLGENGLSYNFDEIKDDKFTTAVCKITHELGHSEISSFKIPIGTEDFMNDVQKYGARMTFAKRYAFCNALGILTGDEDTDATTEKPKNAKSIKSKILFALRDLGEDTRTKESCDSAVKKLAQLEVIDENLDEILGRLEVLVEERNNENPKIQ